MAYRDDALMKASNDVTDSLRRTMGLMQQELERSVLSTQMLGEYSKYTGTLLHGFISHSHDSRRKVDCNSKIHLYAT